MAKAKGHHRKIYGEWGRKLETHWEAEVLAQGKNDKVLTMELKVAGREEGDQSQSDVLSKLLGIQFFPCESFDLLPCGCALHLSEPFFLCKMETDSQYLGVEVRIEWENLFKLSYLLAGTEEVVVVLRPPLPPFLVQ